jgi:sec-independent protein translocase protein TatC
MAQTRPADDDQSRIEQSRAPFLAHLEELRWRLWRSIIAVIIAAVASYFLHDVLYTFLTAPLYETLAKHHLETAVKFRTVQGPFMFHMKVAMIGGVFFGLPYVLYQIWQFVAPGLYRREKRIVIPFVTTATLFFVAGAAFCYYWVIPYGFDFFLDYAVVDGPNKLLPELNIEDYLDMVMKMLLAFGGVFEMPLVCAFLAGVGVLSHRGMIKVWRYATVAIFVIAAVLTPPDWISQVMMAIPLLALYWLSVGVCWFIATKREKAAALAASSDETDLAPTSRN